MPILLTREQIETINLKMQENGYTYVLTWESGSRTFIMFMHRTKDGSMKAEFDYIINRSGDLSPVPPTQE